MILTHFKKAIKLQVWKSLGSDWGWKGCLCYKSWWERLESGRSWGKVCQFKKAPFHFLMQRWQRCGEVQLLPASWSHTPPIRRRIRGGTHRSKFHDGNLMFLFAGEHYSRGAVCQWSSQGNSSRSHWADGSNCTERHELSSCHKDQPGSFGTVWCSSH